MNDSCQTYLNNGNFTEVIANKPFNIKRIINNILFLRNYNTVRRYNKKRVASERIEDRNNGRPFHARPDQYEYRFIDLSQIDAHTDNITPTVSQLDQQLRPNPFRNTAEAASSVNAAVKVHEQNEPFNGHKRRQSC